MPLFRAAYRVDVRNKENVGPPEAPCLIVCNHNMPFDWGVLMVAVPASFRAQSMAAAGAESIYGNRVRGFVSSLALNAFPFAKEGPAIRSSLLFARKMLAEGWSIVILPEGTRESDVPMRRFKPGIGWLVARTGAEVLPIRIDVLRPGLFDGGSWLRPRGHVRVNFGPRIRLDPEQPYEAITAELEDAVREA